MKVGLGFIADLLMRVGLIKGIALITIFAVTASVLMTFAWMAYIDQLHSTLDWLLPSALAPAIIAPTVAWVMLALMHRLHAAQSELARLSETDVLTGAFNRRKLIEFASSDFAMQSVHFSVLVIDIDHFKTVNDTHGHDKGDDVLIAVANACAHGLRSTDVFARWGGEEFVAILPATDLYGALAVADKLRISIAKVEILSAGETVSASIGVATSNTETEAFSSVLKRADQQMYKAKQSGRNRVHPETTAAA